MKHPDPWYGYGYLEVGIRERFACFEGEAWFKALVIAYCQAADRDDEWGEEDIVRSLEETAMLRGIEIEPRACSWCEEPKLEIEFDNTTCWSCQEAHDEEARQKAQAQAEWDALSPEEKERRQAEDAQLIRIFLGGLMARDVQ